MCLFRSTSPRLVQRPLLYYISPHYRRNVRSYLSSHQPTAAAISLRRNPDPRLCLIEQTAAMRITIIRRDIDILIRMLRHAEIGRREHRIDDTGRRSSGHGRNGLCLLRLLHASVAATTTRRRYTARTAVRHLRRAGRVTAVRIDWARHGIAVGRDVWLLLRHGRVLAPAPAFFELLEHERDAPAGFFVDFGEDLQYLFLLAAICQALRGMR